MSFLLSLACFLVLHIALVSPVAKDLLERLEALLLLGGVRLYELQVLVQIVEALGDFALQLD